MIPINDIKEKFRSYIPTFKQTLKQTLRTNTVIHIGCPFLSNFLCREKGDRGTSMGAFCVARFTLSRLPRGDLLSSVVVEVLQHGSTVKFVILKVYDKLVENIFNILLSFEHDLTVV